ncbi:MAG: hypothetical protein EBR71_01395 [Planctomycetes bacterium]|nr:hypothetical protein [Planctomycetota bacterium]
MSGPSGPRPPSRGPSGPRLPPRGPSGPRSSPRGPPGPRMPSGPCMPRIMDMRAPMPMPPRIRMPASRRISFFSSPLPMPMPTSSSKKAPITIRIQRIQHTRFSRRARRSAQQHLQQDEALQHDGVGAVSVIGGSCCAIYANRGPILRQFT